MDILMTLVDFILHVDRHVRYGLGTVNQHGHAVRVRQRDHLPDRIDGAQHVRHMRHRHQPRARADGIIDGSTAPSGASTGTSTSLPER